MKRSFVLCVSIVATVLASGQSSCTTQTRSSAETRTEVESKDVPRTPEAAASQKAAQTPPVATSQQVAETQPVGTSQGAAAQTQPAPFKPEELEQIVAPIALYPDALLAQIFMASTYPLEVVQAARWSKEHPQVKGEAVSKEMEKQPWDPSVKSLVAFPDVLAMMNEKLDWTQKLGDAVLAQRKDAMDAVQRLRTKAKEAGHLDSSKEQTVRTEPAPAGAAPTTEIIVIESPDPEIVYVPTYNPSVVYGAWPYPAYPPYYYYPPGYAAGTAFFSFSMGVVAGGALWGGCNWGYGDIDVNVNRYNSFNRTNLSANRSSINNGRWQHDSQHRQGVGYRDSATQQKYGRGSSQQGLQSREDFRGHADQGRQQSAREGAGSERTLSGSELGTRDGGGSQYRDLGGGQSGDLAGSQGRDLSASQNRDVGGSQSRSANASSARSSDAFSGVGNASSARSHSSRGMSSRGGMSRGGGRRR